MKPRHILLTGARCLCRSCGRYFESPECFDMHRKHLPEKGAPAARDYAKAPAGGCVDPRDILQLVERSGVWSLARA